MFGSTPDRKSEFSCAIGERGNARFILKDCYDYDHKKSYASPDYKTPNGKVKLSIDLSDVNDIDLSNDIEVKFPNNYTFRFSVDGDCFSLSDYADRMLFYMEYAKPKVVE